MRLTITTLTRQNELAPRRASHLKNSGDGTKLFFSMLKQEKALSTVSASILRQTPCEINTPIRKILTNIKKLRGKISGGLLQNLTQETSHCRRRIK